MDEAAGVLAGLGLLAPAEPIQAAGPEGVAVPVFPSVPGGAGVVVHRWTAHSLARLADPAGLAAVHRAAAEYWRWRVATWPQDGRQDVRDMLEVRYHAHAAGDLQTALAATYWVCGRLHTWGAWGWEEQLHRETLTWVGEGSREQAAGYHQLGRIAQARGEYGQAERWYRRSLTIAEDLGDQAGIADSLGQLGRCTPPVVPPRRWRTVCAA